MGRVLHVDMDSFFVSVELLRDPALRGKPVAVGHPGPRGVVASASYEARAFGVRSGMASARAKRLCPGLLFVPGGGGYSSWSRRVGEILEGYSPVVDAASIDEFYLDLGGCERLHGNFFAMAGRARRQIWERLALPASMGLGANRTLAKIASKVAKPRGIAEVLEGEEESFMAPLPVRLIPGVGPATGEALARLGVHTAGELAAVPLVLLERLLGAWGLVLHLKARGLWRGGAFEEDDRPPVSVGHETTFEEDTVDPLFLEASLFTLVERAAHRLRGLGLEAARVTVKVRYADFSTKSRAGRMEPTCLDRDIFRAALPLMNSLTQRRLRVRLVGVALDVLRPAGYQEELFGGRGSPRRLEACRCLDRLKRKFGSQSVRWASGAAV